MDRVLLCRIIAGLGGLCLAVSSSHAAVLLTSTVGTEGVSSDTVTVSVDRDGKASVPTDFSVSGSTAEPNAFNTSFSFTMDAVSLMDFKSGAKLADGTIDRDSVGKLGVRQVNNGINQFEGFLLGLDATGLPVGYAWQLTGIQFEYVNGDESYTVVNRNDPGQKVSGSSDSMIDLSGLNLIVQGGSSDAEFVSVFANGTSDPDSGFRITAFEFEAVDSAVGPGNSWRSVLYPQDWQPPTNRSFATDKMIQDFSYAGYHRGEDPIPNVTGPVFDAVSCGADSNGVSDSTEAIQDALTAAGAAGGGVVLLSPGTFKLSLPAGKGSVLEIRGPGVVLRGSGPEQTFLLNTTPVMRGKSIIHFWNSATEGSPVYLTADLPNPTKRLPVANAAAFSVGDSVALLWDFTPEWVAEHNQQAWWNETNGYPEDARYQREVMAINTNENWIEVDVPTRYTVKTRDKARVIRLGSLVEECGVENLSMGDVQNPGSDWGEEDYLTPGTSAYDVHGSALLYIQKSRDCWVSNVKSYQATGNTSTCNMLSNGIRIYKSSRITVQDCLMQRPQYGGGGGNGYMYRLQQADDCLIQDCTANFSRHGFVVSHAGTSGDVFHRCEDRISNHATGSTGSYITSHGDGSDNHMHFSHSCLWDQCTAFDSFWEAVHRGYPGIPGQGLTTAHSVYWNTSGSGTQYPDKLVVTEQGDYGYVIGTSGDVDAVENRDPSRHNTEPLDHVEGVGLGNRLYPQSLYSDQLFRRLGLSVFVESVGSSEPGSAAEMDFVFSSDGTVVSSNADFALTGSGSDQDAAGDSIHFSLDAMSLVNTNAGVNLGAKLADGMIDRDRVGKLGVRGVNNGINQYEGLAFSIDASALDTSLRLQLTRIDVQYVDSDESLTIVNRRNPAKWLSAGGSSTGSDITIGNRETRIDVSTLDLWVAGGDSALVAALYGNGMSATNDNFRVTGFAFKVVPVLPSLIFSGIEYNGSAVKLNWSSRGLTAGVDIYRAVDLNGMWEQIATNDKDTHFFDLVLPTNPSVFYRAEQSE